MCALILESGLAYLRCREGRWKRRMAGALCLWCCVMRWAWGKPRWKNGRFMWASPTRLTMRCPEDCKKARWWRCPATRTLRTAWPSRSLIPIRVSFEDEPMPTKVPLLAVALLVVTTAGVGEDVKPDGHFNAALEAYEASEYGKAAELLRQAAERDPRNAEVQLLLAKTYYESQLHDAAIVSAERAVALEPENSRYHEWLGRTYGEKADHA